MIAREPRGTPAGSRRAPHGLRQQVIETAAPQSNGQDDLLIRLRAPTAAIHHPQEVRLDPTHARERELAAERAMLGREASDARAIGLVDDDAVAIELRENVPASPWPARDLRLVALGDRGHQLATL
jgi:hypothetical protein